MISNGKWFLFSVLLLMLSMEEQSSYSEKRVKMGRSEGDKVGELYLFRIWKYAKFKCCCCFFVLVQHENGEMEGEWIKKMRKNLFNLSWFKSVSLYFALRTIFVPDFALKLYFSSLFWRLVKWREVLNGIKLLLWLKLKLGREQSRRRFFLRCWSILSCRWWFQSGSCRGICIHALCISIPGRHEHAYPRRRWRAAGSDESFHGLHRRSRDLFQLLLCWRGDTLGSHSWCSLYGDKKKRRLIAHLFHYSFQSYRVKRGGKGKSVIFAQPYQPGSFDLTRMTHGDWWKSSSMNSNTTVVCGVVEVIWMQTVESDATRFNILDWETHASCAFLPPIGPAPKIYK